MPSPIEQALQRDASNLFPTEEDKDTFLRRLRRSMKRPVHQNTVEEFFEDALRIDTEHDDFPFSIQNLEKIVLDSGGKSKTALSMLESAVCCVIGQDALQRGDTVKAASAFAEAYRKNSLVVRWDCNWMGPAFLAFQQLYQDTSAPPRIRAEALFVHANLLFLQHRHSKGLQEIQLAQVLLPQDPFFPAVEGCVWAMLLERAKARQALDKAARLGCPDPEHSLFHRAVLLDSSEDDQVAIDLLEKFVDVAHPDARKLPEACYRLALLYGYRAPPEMGAAKRYFLRGGLRIFPDEASSWRETARALVKGYIPCGYEKCRAAALSPCSVCGKAYYCSQECLNADWPSHKSSCKKQTKKKKAKKKT
jgi:tetratricopeptide (TPR) repeat protein